MTCEYVAKMAERRTGRWLRQPIDVVLPTRLFVRGARVLALLLPVVMVVVGLVGALVAAHAAERGAPPGARTLNQWIKSPLLYH